ncbi:MULTISPECIES: GNAT family N-acetyltransferase [Actinoalloteichus]|uniref:Acetyltransferase, ribosomal protein N-acetylase n=1 Tax=Actinoalloteichus fjordicus TaxID=1612552 RepID=A0AAC9PSI0_9PSEU|nr:MULTISPECIES: GNAT family protein [Actinoalloteichus]APU15022.1 acetyltransferase, ribosomal protein N-acetylase [Actinoalloteichus fjordicus]APU21090.1 acetyltransferase, ribosomal protein N-acetylase [Actinoalloteichus sp. GBA129-24]
MGDEPPADHASLLPRLAAERVVLRAFRPADAAALAAYRSDPAVARYQAWDTPLSEEQAAESIAGRARADPDQPGWTPYAVALDGVLIGDVGVNLHDNRMQADIGFTLASAFHGRGYATEAVGRVLDHLFLDRGLHRVSAECDPRNDASVRLLDRLGFRREGLRRANTWLRGEWADDLLFGLLAADYRAARG